MALWPIASGLTKGQSQFAKFLVVGALNTAVGYGNFALLVLLNLDPGLALFLATALGVVFSYFSNGRLVFAMTGFGRLPRFVAVYGLTFLINLEGLKLLMSAGLAAIVAQAILFPAMVVLSFALNRIFVFRTARHS